MHVARPSRRDRNQVTCHERLQLRPYARTRRQTFLPAFNIQVFFFPLLLQTVLARCRRQRGQERTVSRDSPICLVCLACGVGIVRLSFVLVCCCKSTVRCVRPIGAPLNFYSGGEVDRPCPLSAPPSLLFYFLRHSGGGKPTQRSPSRLLSSILAL